MQRFSRAFAKINLGLLIHQRRPDGYHDIETVFHRIDLADELLFEPAQGIAVDSSAPDTPSGEGNLCHTAVRLLQEELDCQNGVRITLTKKIPAGAGLGGGSSDAAVTLREVPALWGVNLEPERLETLAGKLGSDVAYFLRPGSALATGRGERLEYFDLDIPYAILLCTPRCRVSTPWAYRQIIPGSRRTSSSLRESVIAGIKDPSLLPGTVVNDFEEPVFASYPEIGSVKRALLELGAIFALMSGSGSSVYGLFAELEAADEAGSRMTERGCRTALTRPHFQPGVYFSTSRP
ncbi:MAG TPA: 4-(cytidine 5'-diphospho)-2-C-methyl-D-erythritol kinase [Bacteroidota bacterium]